MAASFVVGRASSGPASVARPPASVAVPLSVAPADRASGPTAMLCREQALDANANSVAEIALATRRLGPEG
jgi:hypothetical protein